MRKWTIIILVGMSDTHHSRVAGGTHVCPVSDDRAADLLCERLPARAIAKKGQLKGVRKTIIPADSRCYNIRQNLKSQPRGIDQNKRGGQVGRFTRVKRGYDPRVLIHHTTTNQFQCFRHTIKGASTWSESVTLEMTTRKARTESEKGVPFGNRTF